jgi:hypothetical protein
MAYDKTDFIIDQLETVCEWVHFNFFVSLVLNLRKHQKDWSIREQVGSQPDQPNHRAGAGEWSGIGPGRQPAALQPKSNGGR